MKTILAILFAASAAACTAQDTPSWWPPALHRDSVHQCAPLIYDRPLASFNHPISRAPMVLVALRDPATGQWWRTLAHAREVAAALPGDTVTMQCLLP